MRIAPGAAVDDGMFDVCVVGDVSRLTALRQLANLYRGTHVHHPQVGDLQLNPDTREVKRGDREIELTNREFELLEYLAQNQRLVVSRERLLEDVWGYDPFEQTNTRSASPPSKASATAPATAIGSVQSTATA